MENLRLADEIARRGKLRSYGVKVFDRDREKNFCRTAARLNKRNPPLLPAEYKQRICSCLGWAKYSDSKHLLKTIIKPHYYGKL